MAKIRIYEISKKLNVSNKEVLDTLDSLGIKDKTHSSSIDSELAARIESILKKKESAPEKKPSVVSAPESEKRKTEPERAAQARKPLPPTALHKKPKKDIPSKKAVEPFIPVAEEEEEDIALPERFKKDIDGKKVEKLKSKSLQRAFQAIRKIEPKRWVETKPVRRGGRGKITFTRRYDAEQAHQQAASTAAPRKKAIKVQEGITVKDFAEQIGQKVSEVIKKFMELGSMVTINQPVDMDAMVLVADSLGVKVEPAFVEEEAPEITRDTIEKPEDLRHRAPVITVMGHVDHGKTSLLDAIRETRVTETEAGGITQHIGAYKVNLKGKDIVFLDTPGHEAFTTLRARGAQATDIVVLVVAADDGVMPQTVEAINHAKAAGVPIIVAVNKIDKPGANPERVRRELAEHEIVPEEWGGKNIFVDVSAKKKTGIDELLEMIILQSEVMEMKANPDRAAKGVIIESRLDKGIGPVATVLVQTGTLRISDAFVSGNTFGKVRALVNDRGKRVMEAVPSTPVEVIGFSEIPQAGDHFVVVDGERRAKQIAIARKNKERLTEISKARKIKLDELYAQIKEGQIKELNIIIKADVQGSVEAIRSAFEKITHPKVKVRVIHTAVGGINESDVMLAVASNAIIIGFNVRPDPKATQASEREGVDIRLYTIIYEAIEDVRKALEGMLEPTLKEKVTGKAEVREIFPISRVGTVAGCYVLEGTMQRASDGIRVIRDNIVIYQGMIGSLKRFKEDVREVNTGYECGIMIENFNDLKVGDILENFIIEKIAAKL